MKNRTRNLAVIGLAAALLAPLGLRADEASADDNLEELRATLGDLSAQVNELKSAQHALKWGVNTDLRFDYAPYKHNGSTNLATNKVGMYAKRVELQLTGHINKDFDWTLQFEFAALKLEDLGVLANAILPTVDLKAGLFRQPFGIENQTGSSGLPFPERAMIDGGYNPTPLSTKIVSERVMGVQLTHGMALGPVAYKLQVAVADNVNDQAPGVSADTLGQATDQDPTEIGRLGIDLNFIPGVALNIGASALHDSQNTALMTSAPANQFWADNVGYDFTLDVPVAKTKIWGEWVSQNKFKNSPDAGTFVNREEGWYVTDQMKPLAFFDSNLSNIELSGRWERVLPTVDVASGATAIDATTIGVKYLYSGKNYTSVNYTCYAYNGDFSILGPDSLLSVQQQFNF